jgi:Aspartyl protease
VNIRLWHGLPFVQVTLEHHGAIKILEMVLLDTGSAGTVLNTLRLREMGIGFAPGDPVHKIRGVGGSEFVFNKQLERISVLNLELQDFHVEVSPMKYGIEMDGILGLDFLTQTRAIIDLNALTLRSSTDF